jgi:DNA polymerase III subunit chi
VIERRPLAEVLFYHLDQRPLDEVLPALVEKSIERGWRAVLQAASVERIEALDQLLWTYSEASFIPHGTAKTGHAALQPVYLTTGTDNPNGATVRFMLDGAVLEPLPEQLTAYARVVFLFDGGVPEELDTARVTWKAVKAAGAAATYWQQSETGAWQKKA